VGLIRGEAYSWEIASKLLLRSHSAGLQPADSFRRDGQHSDGCDLTAVPVVMICVAVQL
jgi:hypothetical protein